MIISEGFICKHDFDFSYQAKSYSLAFLCLLYFFHILSICTEFNLSANIANVLYPVLAAIAFNSQVDLWQRVLGNRFFVFFVMFF